MGCVPSKGDAKDIQQVSVPTQPSVPGQSDSRLGKPTHQLTLFTKATLTRHMSGGLSADYELRETVRNTACAEVKKAIYVPTATVRTVKVIQKRALDEDTTTVEGKPREVVALQKLDHPCVSRLLEVSEDRFRVFLVMEEETGEEMLKCVQEHAQHVGKFVSSIARQLLSTVEYCHSQGVFLPGLGLDCVLVKLGENSAFLRLCDFSEARFEGERRQAIKRKSICTAPEVLKNECGPEADLWSCGVILHVLLFGRPPYLPPPDGDILPVIESGNLSLGDLSPLPASLSSLLVGLLTFTPSRRISLQKALSNPWLEACDNPVDETRCQAVMAEMRSFRASYRLKEAIFTFMSFHLVTAAETTELTEVFRALDRNGDGKVSRQELLDYYRETNREVSTLQGVEDMLSQIDSDGSGFIEFSEFLKATLNKRKYLSRQYLEQAFAAFDIDHSGKISLLDLQDLARSSSAATQRLITDIMEEADFNQDGEIDLAEFQSIALKRF